MFWLTSPTGMADSSDSIWYYYEIRATMPSPSTSGREGPNAMTYVQEQPTHEEINLVRLLRRLEKSVASPQDWNSGADMSVDQVLLNVHKTCQKVKFARQLIRGIELECEDTPDRSKRLTDSKIRLDRIDSFLEHIEKTSQRPPVKRESLLAKLPIPKPKEQPAPDNAFLVPISDSGQQNPSQSMKELSIISPDEAEISPSLISTALPSLLPINPSETANTSAFNPSFGRPAPTIRKAGGSNQATNAIHEELSSQLEQMAQQLKRNAIHFSTSLAKDKASIEDAAEKIERNLDTMQSQRIKLRDRSTESRSNTWLVMGIILLVILLFMLMVMVIRFF